MLYTFTSFFEGPRRADTGLHDFVGVPRHVAAVSSSYQLVLQSDIALAGVKLHPKPATWSTWELHGTSGVAWRVQMGAKSAPLHVAMKARFSGCLKKPGDNEKRQIKNITKKSVHTLLSETLLQSESGWKDRRPVLPSSSHLQPAWVWMNFKIWIHVRDC